MRKSVWTLVRQLRGRREELRKEQQVERRIVETELRRGVITQQMVPAARALALIAAVADAVTRYVSNRDEVAAVRREFLRLTASPTELATLDAEAVRAAPDTDEHAG